MNTQQNTVLITGGSAGIGFEIAKLLTQKGNRVIITGRNAERLQAAVALLPGATAIVGDVAQADDVQRLVRQLNDEFPALNMVINNVGAASGYNLADSTDAFDKAQEEMLTNYLAIIRLNERLLSLLQRQSAAAIVNVSSVLAFVPNYAIPTYGASKAALHSYTKSLRYALAESPVKVFELMPPLVNTDFSQAIGGNQGIAPSVVADELLKALEQNTYEIRVGDTEKLYQLSLADPASAFAALNPSPISNK